MPTLFSPLRRYAIATSDGTGAATFKFDPVTPQTVWRGSVFIDMAPATASSRVLVNGFDSWGSVNGGGSLTVEALAGEIIQISTTGLAATTTYTACLKGNELHAQTAAEVGYSSPFPASTR